MQPVLRRLGVVGVRGSHHTSRVRPEEALSKLESKDNWESLSQAPPHSVEVAGDPDSLRDLVLHGLVEAILIRPLVHDLKVEGPVLSQAGALHLQGIDCASQGHAFVLWGLAGVLVPLHLVLLPPDIVDEQPGDVANSVSALHGLPLADVLIGSSHCICAAGVALRLILHVSHVGPKVNLLRKISLPGLRPIRALVRVKGIA
mmetsp:Transcript_45921/g.71945  ORF Transcript_45921/g.71945 Transcript_45921/m.71945 type:complete len:202 (+) Transcript_45921:731-1336(+)